MINKITTLTSITLFVAFSIIVAAQISDAKRLTEGELPKPLIASVESWQRAAKARNVDALVASTWPEYRPESEQELRTAGSPLYVAVLSTKGPLQQLLTGKQPRLLVYEQAAKGYAVRSFGVCLDGRAAQEPLGTKFIDIISVRRADLFCTYWVMEPEGTFISYTFGFKNF